MSALELRELTYRYPGAREPALRGIDLAIEAGEFVVLAGTSGSGKSTLLRAGCGLVPHFHGGEIAGRVVVCGMDTREHGPSDLAAVAGALFQDPESQVVMGTVRAELAFPLENRGLPAAGVARGVEEAALALGIAHLLDRSTSELSGGELQRVALGAALAGRPRIVLLDEPTSQLDPVAGDELIGLLRRLNEEVGTAVVIAEHRLERCLPAADRVIALAGGEVACDAPPRDFLDWALARAPALATPAARLFGAAGLRPLPTGVKQARAALADHGATVARTAEVPSSPPSNPPSRDPALVLERVWLELRDGPAILRGTTLQIAAGERVALMGRNGAGKSTLLRTAAGLLAPTRGRVRTRGRVALLLQNPNDYLVRERVAEEASPAGLAHAGLAALAERHPRDLSGGERQRLALALVTEAAGGEPPAVVCLDEPTRGMDREHREHLIEDLRGRAEAGAAVLVATHDPEFAAAVAERVVLLGEGTVLADGPAAEVLSGGWYFATETARILDAAALLPQDGALLLRDQLEAVPAR